MECLQRDPFKLFTLFSTFLYHVHITRNDQYMNNKHSDQSNIKKKTKNIYYFLDGFF
jgi:hypothetical protein